MIGFEKTRVAEEVARHLLRSIFDHTIYSSVKHHPDIFVRVMPEAESTLAYHQGLIDALAAGDADSAADLTERYLDEIVDRMEVERSLK